MKHLFALKSGMSIVLSESRHCFWSKLTRVGRIWLEYTKLLMAPAAVRKMRSRARYWTQPHLSSCHSPGL